MNFAFMICTTHEHIMVKVEINLLTYSRETKVEKC